MSLIAALFASAILCQAPGQSEYESTVPPPISSTDLDRYERWLDLAAPQRTFIDQRHTMYVESWHRCVQDRLPEVRNLSAAAADYQPGQWMPWHAEWFVQYVNAENSLVMALLMLDQTLLSDIQSILAPAQEAALKRVRDDRTRRARWTGGVRIRAASIDVGALAEEVIGAEACLAIDAALAEYEQDVTPVFRELDGRSRVDRANIEKAKIDWWFDERGERVRPGMPEWDRRDREARQRIESLLAPQARLQDRIVKRNRAALDVIAQGLPPDAASAMRLAYLERAYPDVYPEALRIDAHAEQMIKKMPDESAVTGVELLEAFKRVRDQIVSDMCRSVDDWESYHARHADSLPKREHVERMDSLFARLRDEQAELMKRLNALVAPAVPAQAGTHERDHRREQTAADHRERQSQRRETR